MVTLKKQKGFAALSITLLVLAAIFGLAASITILTLSEYKISRNIIKSSQAYYTAEAGVEDSIYRIVQGKKYQASNSLSVGEGEVDISISGEGDAKIIRVSGLVSQRIRKLKAVVSTDTTIITFHYGAQVDQGGLEIGANASIEGNVYSNGNIIGQGKGSGSKVTGDAWVAGGIAPEPDQQCIIQNSDFLFGFSNNLDVAQSFQPSQSNKLRRISLNIKKVGNPVDRTVRILTDKNGQPDKNGTITTGTLSASRVGTEYNWIDVSLQDPPDILAGQTYWLMIENSSFPLDFDNYYILGKDIYGSYPNGEGKWSFNWDASWPWWFPIIGDLNFKTWLGGEPTFIDRVWITNDAYANTLLQSWIDGDAYYQVIDDKTTVEGNQYPNSPDPSNKDLPISYAQIQDWEAAAESGGLLTCPYGDPEITCVLEGEFCVCRPIEGAVLGPVKIEGDLIFPSDSLDNPVIITGPIWLTGKISAKNKAGIKLQDSLANGYPIIVDTGQPTDQLDYVQINLDNNVVTQDSSEGGYLLFIAANQRLDDADPIIWLHNNVNADEERGQSIVFSLQGLIKVENNAKFKEITGYAICLENNASIFYEQGLIDSSFSSGPGGGWRVTSWEEIE